MQFSDYAFLNIFAEYVLRHRRHDAISVVARAVHGKSRSWFHQPIYTFVYIA